MDIEDAKKALSEIDKMRVGVAANGNLRVGFSIKDFEPMMHPETGRRYMTRDEVILRARIATVDALREAGAENVALWNTRTEVHAGRTFFVYSPSCWVNNNAPSSTVENSAAVSKLEARLARTEAALEKSMALLARFAEVSDQSDESDESEIP